MFLSFAELETNLIKQISKKITGMVFIFLT